MYIYSEQISPFGFASVEMTGLGLSIRLSPCSGCRVMSSEVETSDNKKAPQKCGAVKNTKTLIWKEHRIAAAQSQHFSIF